MPQRRLLLKRDGQQRTQLPGRHRRLLGLHRYRRRHPHAGGALLPPAGLFTFRGGHAVPVLRVLRHRHQPGGRLAGGTYRPEPHHAHRHGDAGGRTVTAYRPRCLAVGALCHGCAGTVRHCQGPEQDVGEGERQDACRERWREEAVPLGGGTHRLQECAEGRGFLCRCRPARMDRLSRRAHGAGRSAVAGAGRDRAGASQGRRQNEVEAEIHPGLFQHAGHQLAVGGAVFPVRFTRRVVRGGPAGVPLLGTRLEFHPGRWIHRAVGDRLRDGAGERAPADPPQPPRPWARRWHGAAVGLYPGRLPGWPWRWGCSTDWTRRWSSSPV